MKELLRRRQINDKSLVLLVLLVGASFGFTTETFAKPNILAEANSGSSVAVILQEQDQDKSPQEKESASANESLDSGSAASHEEEVNEIPTRPVAKFDAAKTFFSGDSPQSIEELRELELKFAEIAEIVKPATVNIQMGGSQGSGVVVTRDGYILTAAHVIGQPNGKAKVTFPDKREFNATTLGISGRVDSGILKIDDGQETDFPYVEMGISTELKTGQWVMAIGHPGGIDEKRGLVVRAGRVLNASPTVIQTDCTLVGGDSGGPLVDLNGEVIGIHSRIGMNLWDNLHVPVDVYSEKWDLMIEGVVLDGRPGLGFTIEQDSTKVESVAEGGVAEKAGMKVGDVIKKVGSRSIQTMEDLQDARKDLLPNMKIKIVVQRGDEEETLDMVIGRRGN